MTLQELKKECVKRYEAVKTKLLKAKDDALTKRAAAVKVYISIDKNDHLKISVDYDKKAIKAALEHILGD